MDFWDDDRGQSVQVGAVLLFAVLVILLAGYQSTVVPNENRAAEFDHSLETEQDMLDVRNAIIEAYQDGEAAPVSVKLGTTYPRHTFAVNPAPVSGTLSTQDAGNITITAADGLETQCPSPIETKFLNYSAGYNYYSPAPTLVYENTLLYADYGEDRQVVISDQSLVTGNTVNLVALQGEYSENGIGATDFQARAGGIDTTDIGDYNVTVPTRLSSETWERVLLESGHDVTVVDAGDGQVKMVFTEKRLQCSAVGADGTARGGERGDGGGDGAEINPPSLRLESVAYSGKNVTLTINNSGGTTNLTDGRINYYYYQGGGGGPSDADIYGPDGTNLRANLVVGGDLETFEPKIQISSNDPTEVTLVFDKQPNKNQDWFVVTFYTESGEQVTYFVG